MQARRNIIYMVALCFGIKKATALLSFNPEPHQAVNATVEATDVVSTTASGGVWSLNWLFGSIVVAAVDINIASGAIIPSIPSTAYTSRLMVNATPVVAGVFTNLTTVLTIKEVRLSDTFAIRAEISSTLTPNPDSRMLSVKECNDTYQGLTPSNNANYLGTATFKCIGANTVSVIGTCQADATWSISGTCPLVQCNTTAATDSTNGIILTNSALLNTLVNVSDTVSVECDVGFTGVSGTRTCQADTTWSASITCAEVFCNTSTVVSNGICLSSSVSPNSNVAVGSVVSLTCCVGYIPNNGSGTCANDGSWNIALVCTPVPTTPGPTTQTPTAPSDTTPIFTNNTTGTSQPTTTTKNTGCCCWWWCILLIILFFLIGILALVLWTIEFYRIYEPELGYGIKFLMLFGTVTVIPIVVYVIHQYCTRDRGGKRESPLVFGIKDWGVWFILCIWLPLILGILMFRQWQENVYPKKRDEPKQKWFMAICIVLGIPMVIYYFVDKSSVKQSNSSGE